MAGNVDMEEVAPQVEKLPIVSCCPCNGQGQRKLHRAFSVPVRRRKADGPERPGPSPRPGTAEMCLLAAWQEFATVTM